MGRGKKISQFYTALQSGLDQEKAFEQVFGPIQQVPDSLKKYVHKDEMHPWNSTIHRRFWRASLLYEHSHTESWADLACGFLMTLKTPTALLKIIAYKPGNGKGQDELARFEVRVDVPPSPRPSQEQQAAAKP